MAAVLVIIFLLLLCMEYLWLYIISKKQEESVAHRAEINTRVHHMLQAMLNSPTESARQAEEASLLEYMGKDFEKKDEAAILILQLMCREEDLSASKLASLNRIYDAVDPVTLYSELLQKGNPFLRGYACRQLADFGVREKIADIRAILTGRNNQKNLKYNAAMALSEMGDEDSVLYFTQMCERNRKYSHRVLLELFQKYSGDREELVRRIFAQRNNYSRATVIKAYSVDRITALSDVYEQSMDSKDSQLKIAAVKALSQLGEQRFEHKLITVLNDKNWIVRLSAVNGLEKIGTQGALNAIVGAIGDEEWWVRKAAAEALVKLDKNLFYVEKVLSGYDKYAADAVKNALYKTIQWNGGGLT